MRRRRRIAVVVVCAALLAGCSSTSVARESRPQPKVTATTSTTIPPTTTTAVPTTTSTTVPPTTTTSTVPLATVPDAAGPGEQSGSRAVAQSVITQAGFVAGYDPVSSDACYFNSPISGPNSWNAGEVIGQSPLPGTLATAGSTIYLQVCAGTPTINLGP